MTRAYLVKFPGEAEAHYLAGIARHPDASPAQACVQAIRDWLGRLQATGREYVSPEEISADLAPVLARTEAAAGNRQGPECGPFAPDAAGRSRPGRVEYLGDGVVRLDSLALSALACLDHRADFRVTFEDGGPVMIVGHDRYTVTEDPAAP